ncbi:hypothetical protein H6P81_012176 [Aristolochia fimbriata]|uniref:Pentatricopeptide repeat-containing protein n=1 Tax=Aristolochia fimbriata TaxID=158543 RepID=A0AAV7EB69_ARIFI|nr:hypothetical protein H6P81_012176 [Aristolochia fimbriata]
MFLGGVTVSTKKIWSATIYDSFSWFMPYSSSPETPETPEPLFIFYVDPSLQLRRGSHGINTWVDVERGESVQVGQKHVSVADQRTGEFVSDFDGRLLIAISRNEVQIFFSTLTETRPHATTPKFLSLSCLHSHILNASVIVKSIYEAKQLHALAVVFSLFPHHGPTCATLMLSYASFGDISSARILFDSIHYPSTFLYNTLIRAHTICEAHHEAVSIYNQVVRATFTRPDDHTFPFILKACADALAIRKGMEIHGTIIKLAFCRDVFVGNTLVSFYGAVNNLNDAKKVFDEMFDRDIITWNSIITAFSVSSFFLEAIGKFLELNLELRLRPNVVSIVSVLPACAGIEDEKATRQIHGYVVKAGFDSEVTVCNAFVDVYAKCGSLENSKLVFEQMLLKNVVSWNTIIGTFAHVGNSEDAVHMFRAMLAAEVKPNSITFASVLSSLAELELFDMAKEIHGYSIRRGTEFDIFVANSLLDVYAKSGHTKEASNIFYGMESKNLVSWNAMIANLAQNGLELEALKLIYEMQKQGELPNSVTFTNVLPACGRIAAVRKGKEIHGRSIRAGSSSDIFVSNALSDMYAKCGNLNLARNVFENSARDDVSYNILIVSYSQSVNCCESLHLFHQMELAGLKYDVVSFMGVISACANLNAIKQGKEIHAYLTRKLFHYHLFVANSLMDMYIKCGEIENAKLVFDRMKKRDVASWNTMILGYGMRGEPDAAVNLFDKMKVEGVDYDHVSYLVALSACSHGGMIERGKRYYGQMISQNIKPSHMHFAAMIDLLGRAGLMEEAANFIGGLPVKPDANVWGALLGAAKMHKNLEMGRWAAEHLFEIKPEHCGYYILLSNMYAEAGKWDEANSIRELMKLRGIKKSPGCSWIENSEKTFILEERKEWPI